MRHAAKKVKIVVRCCGWFYVGLSLKLLSSLCNIGYNTKPSPRNPFVIENLYIAAKHSIGYKLGNRSSCVDIYQ